MKSNNPGYYKAFRASIEYEEERGRPALPTTNIGLMKYLAKVRGSEAVGACLAADEISGSHLPAQVLRECWTTRQWPDFHQETGQWYCPKGKDNGF